MRIKTEAELLAEHIAAKIRILRECGVKLTHEDKKHIMCLKTIPAVDAFGRNLIFGV